jgi:hypothetical protein
MGNKHFATCAATNAEIVQRLGVELEPDQVDLIQCQPVMPGLKALP